MTKRKEREFTIVHHMSDGEVRDSIEGCVIPVDNPVYAILRELRQQSEMKKMSKEAC